MRANAARAPVGAEAARDLLLDLEHAQVALGLVVVEGDRSRSSRKARTAS